MWTAWHPDRDAGCVETRYSINRQQTQKLISDVHEDQRNMMSCRTVSVCVCVRVHDIPLMLSVGASSSPMLDSKTPLQCASSPWVSWARKPARNGCCNRGRERETLFHQTFCPVPERPLHSHTDYSSTAAQLPHRNHTSLYNSCLDIHAV